MQFEQKQLLFKDRSINFDLRFPDISSGKPIFIFLHGFKGFRNWAFIPHLCEYVAKSGFIALNPDFSLNGVIEQEKPLYDTRIFFDNTVSSMLGDLHLLLNSLIEEHETFDSIKKIWNKQIILAGHSMGGALALLKSDFPLIEKIVLLSPISKFNRNTSRQIQHWMQKGYISIKIPESSQELKLSSNFIKDREKNFSDDVVINAARNCKKPILILHGSEDLTVKKEEGLQLANSNPLNIEFELIEGTGHTFGASHPYKNESKAILRSCETIVNFIKK